MYQKPIFIIGVEHSGTTILYRILAKHPELAWFSQYSLRKGEIPKRKKLPFSSLIKRIGRKVFGVPRHKQLQGLKSLSPTPIECDIWDYLLPDYKLFFNSKDYTIDIANRIKQTVKNECTSWKKERILIKKPSLSRSVLLLNEIFPSGKFIHIIRDGKAVSLSIKTKFAKSPLGSSIALKQSCEYWKEIILYLKDCEEKMKHNFKKISYEDLCMDVKGAIKEVIEFCDLPKSTFPMHQLPLTLLSTNENWINKCKYKDKLLINNLLDETLIKSGYYPFKL